MKRLREQHALPGSLEAAAIELLRSVDHYAPPGPRPMATERRRAFARPSWWLRPAMVATVLVGVAAVASASLSRHWLARQYERLVGHHAAAAKTVARTVPYDRDTAASNSHQTTPAATYTADETPEAPIALRPRDAPRAGTEHRPHAPHRRSLADAATGATRPAIGDGAQDAISPLVPEAPLAITPPASRRPSDDPALVIKAMRVLRRDRDAARAAELLDDYLRRWPEGSLAEEATALAVEAATVRGDRRARELALRYLRQFPDGRFGEVARRALDP